MRLALLSDIHGNLHALEAVASDIRRRGVDHVACLGDHLSGPLLPKETAQYLMSSGWTMLAGNHERQILSYETNGGGASDSYAHSQLSADELHWMRSLLHTCMLSNDVFLCHGTPHSDCEHFLESPTDGVLGLACRSDIHERLGGLRVPLIACGHSHIPRSVRLQSGQLIVNPGGVGLQAYSDDHPAPYVMELGTPDAHYAIVEHSRSGWAASHYVVQYDVALMAAMARARDRLEWENALLYGYVA